MNVAKTVTRYEGAVDKEFNGLSMPMVAHEEELWMTMESIGTALGYSNPRDSVKKIYQRHKDELDLYSCTLKLKEQDNLRPQNGGSSPACTPQYEGSSTTCGVNLTPSDPTCGDNLTYPASQKRNVRVFNEEGVMIITMLSSQPNARDFRSWAVKVLRAYRAGQLTLSRQLPPVHDKFLEKMVVEAGKKNPYAQKVLHQKYGIEPEKVRFVDCPCCQYTFNADRNESKRANLIN